MRTDSDSPFFVAETGRTGKGLFTRRPFALFEQVFLLTGCERELPADLIEDAGANPNWFGIGKQRWIDPDWPYFFVNHSCEPCLAIRGDRTFVAIRNIAMGEELTVDYSITEIDAHWRMDCNCGLPACRTTIRSIQFLPAATFARYLPNVNPIFQEVFRNARENGWDNNDLTGGSKSL